MEIVENGILTAATGMNVQFCQIPMCFVKHEKVVAILSSCPTSLSVYALLRDRWNMSYYNQDKFTEEDGKIFLIYAQKELAEQLRCTASTIERAFKVLKKIGALVVKRNGFSNTCKLYLTSPETIVAVCENTHREQPIQTRTDNGSKPAQKLAPYNNNKYNNNDSSPVSKDTGESLPPSAIKPSEKTKPLTKKPLGENGTIFRPLFKTPAKTKTQKNTEKWFRERCTQINGHGFARDVEVALQSFLRSLAEPGTSNLRISANSFALQLDHLHRLDEFPELQKEAVYAATAGNYRSFLISVNQVARHNNIQVLEEQEAVAHFKSQAPNSGEEEEEF